MAMLLGCSDSNPVSGAPARLTAPAGFRTGVFAEGLRGVRFMALGPDGQVYVSQPGEGRVLRLPDRDQDGVSEAAETLIDGLDRPHGLAFLGERLYIAENGRVVRVRVRPGPTRAESLTVIIPDLPSGGGHWTRTVVVDPQRQHLLVSAGSSCNVCVEDDPRRAAVTRYRIDGSGETVFARGLRNAVGLTFRPGTGELWATDNGRDWLGDDLPPEEIVNILVEGGDYGWPSCYGDRVLDPEFGDPERCAASIPPALTDTAHVAPLGCAFYTGTQFPEAYRGDFFVACHGSWNRSHPVGYKVLHVEVEAGRPVRATTFLGGFRRGGEIEGRPVDVLVAADGSLLVTDDYGGRIYRVRWGSG